MTKNQKKELAKIFISLHKPTITLINKRIEKEFQLIKKQIVEDGLSLDAVLDGNMILQREGIKSYVELYYAYLFENVIDFIEKNFDDEDDDSDEDDDDYSDDNFDDSDDDDVEDDSNTSTESNE